MEIEATAMILGFLALLALRVPIAFAMILSASALLVSTAGFGVLQLAAQRVYAGINAFPLLAVPFFIFTANVMNRCGLTEIMYNFANMLFGRATGGLAHANIGASMLFAGVSGSAVADAAGLGMVEIRGMTRSGYDAPFSAAVTAASSILGPIIPPSIPLIIYATMVGASVSDLFLAGLVPGIAMALLMMAVVHVMAHRRGYGRQQSATLRAFVQAGLQTLPGFLVPVIIIAGIVGGFFTATESATIAAAYAVVIAVLVYRKMTLRIFYDVSIETITLTAQVMFIVGAASFFAWALAFLNIPALLADTLLTFIDSPAGFLILVALVLLVLGTFMESMALLLILVPIFLPVIEAYEIDLVFFGVYMTVLLAIGLVTPPVGLCLFAVSTVAKIPTAAIVREILPFYAAMILFVVVMIAWPELVTFLPRAVGS